MLTPQPAIVRMLCSRHLKRLEPLQAVCLRADGQETDDETDTEPEQHHARLTTPPWVPHDGSGDGDSLSVLNQVAPTPLLSVDHAAHLRAQD